MKSLVFDPKHSECRVMAGIALHGVGNLTEAIKHYTILVEEENPENIDDVQSSMDESESEPKAKLLQSLAVLAYGHGISAKWLVICKVSWTES